MGFWEAELWQIHSDLDGIWEVLGGGEMKNVCDLNGSVCVWACSREEDACEEGYSRWEMKKIDCCGLSRIEFHTRVCLSEFGLP